MQASREPDNRSSNSAQPSPGSRNRLKTLVWTVAFTLYGIVTAQTAPLPATGSITVDGVVHAVSELPGIIDTLMEQSGLPGLAVSVV